MKVCSVVMYSYIAYVIFFRDEIYYTVLEYSHVYDVPDVDAIFHSGYARPFARLNRFFFVQRNLLIETYSIGKENALVRKSTIGP
jgi:hypothetical protein